MDLSNTQKRKQEQEPEISEEDDIDYEDEMSENDNEVIEKIFELLNSKLEAIDERVIELATMAIDTRIKDMFKQDGIVEEICRTEIRLWLASQSLGINELHEKPVKTTLPLFPPNRTVGPLGRRSELNKRLL